MKDKYKTLITACWLVLISCFIVKLLGGNWFEIACSNEKFIRFCNWVGVKTFQYYILAMITSLIANSLLVMSILKEKYQKNKLTLFIISYLIVFNIIKYICDKYLAIQFISVLIDIICGIVIPIILKPKTWYRALIGFILMFVFQLISLVVKNIGIKRIDDNVVVSLIFMIDYYIMFVLYYLYSTKEENKNGCFCNVISRFRKRRNH